VENWKEAGACIGADPDLFFPISNQADHAAKAICARCIVRVQCLDEALRHDEWGVWGGTNEVERRKILRRYVRVRGRKTLAEPLAAV